MKKAIFNLISIIATSILIASCSEKEIKCTLTGHVIGRDSDTLYLSKATEYSTEIMIPIIDSSFEYHLTIPQTEAYMLIFKEEYIKGAMQPVYFFPENGKIIFELHSMNDFDKNQTNGGKLNEEYKNYRKKYNEIIMPRYKPLNDSVTALLKRKEYYSEEMNDLLIELRNVKESNARDSVMKKISLLKSSGNDVTPKVKLINIETNKIILESNEWRFRYIETHPTLVSYYLLLADAKELEYKQVKLENVKKGFEIFSKKYPAHPYTNQLKAIIDGLEKIRVGGKYIDFKLPDIDGNIHSLSEIINSKFALIDLWATWCGPCIKNSRAMIPVYERFKDKGFTVCGVAGEFKNTDQLKATLEKEKFPWLTLVEIDNKNQIWNLYGKSNSGGGTFLVDKDGLILAIDPTPQKVEEILNERLK